MVKFLAIIFLTIFYHSNIYSQTLTDKQPFEFSYLTFHATACNGTCPEISMNLYKDKRIELLRRIYKAKGQVDTSKTGNFKGELSDKDFKIIVSYLSKINWDTISFPKIYCCDGSVKTILISYNGKYKKFKSMLPPQSIQPLFSYLTKLCSKIVLTKYNKPIDFLFLATSPALDVAFFPKVVYINFIQCHLFKGNKATAHHQNSSP